MSNELIIKNLELELQNFKNYISTQNDYFQKQLKEKDDRLRDQEKKLTQHASDMNYLKQEKQQCENYYRNELATRITEYENTKNETLHLKNSLQQKGAECSQLQNLLNKDASNMKQRDKTLRETVALAQVKILDLQNSNNEGDKNDHLQKLKTLIDQMHSKLET
ncbi:hypothetical protein CRE_20878 [Caenorhabditis remanei]|uniref:Uncharacterized protein n=1 Tax=Caenorhabditis remanei TaxID=31234 RepID=E3MV25_CAERE|nr:hypothetical protein CRE_20878 [Caenorhabditis remanei]